MKDVAYLSALARLELAFSRHYSYLTLNLLQNFYPCQKIRLILGFNRLEREFHLSVR
jgi:hypothetical protein